MNFSTEEEDADARALKPSWFGAGEGPAGIVAAVIAGGFVVHLTVDGIDYARGAAGLVAFGLGAVGPVLGLRRQRRPRDRAHRLGAPRPPDRHWLRAGLRQGR